MYPAGFWSIIELNVSIICACMPAARQFLRQHFPAVLGSTYDASKGPSNGYIKHYDQSVRPTGMQSSYVHSSNTSNQIVKTISIDVTPSREVDEIELIDNSRATTRIL